MKYGDKRYRGGKKLLARYFSLIKVKDVAFKSVWHCYNTDFSGFILGMHS